MIKKIYLMMNLNKVMKFQMMNQIKLINKLIKLNNIKKNFWIKKMEINKVMIRKKNKIL